MSWLGCRYGGGGGICGELSGAVSIRPQFSLAAVGSNQWDVGPFGHVDLYGNAIEWVRSSILEPTDPAFCALPSEGPEPLTFTATLPASTYVRQLADTLMAPTSGTLPTDSKGRPWLTHTAVYFKQGPLPFTGFRCAFPAQ